MVTRILMGNFLPYQRLCQKHKMKIGTIRDLIAYRRRHDHVVERRAETSFESKWGGEWKAITFFNRATVSGDEVRFGWRARRASRTFSVEMVTSGCL